MAEIDLIVRLLAPLIAATALFVYHRQIAEEIENFTNRFRGGPPPPMHPSPAGDDEFLRRRRY